MKFVKRLGYLFIVVLAVFFVITNYSWVFSKRIKGEVIEIERVMEPTAILGSRIKDDQIHSFAVAIRDDKGEIHTASGTDQQWSVAKKGYCIDALFYRYPPWDLDKGGTFFNARVLSMSDCKKVDTQNSAPAAPAADSSAVPSTKEP